MTDAEQTQDAPQKHKVDIGNNVPLSWLYILAGLGLAIGALIFGISSWLADMAYDPTDALAWQASGVSLFNGGGLFLLGAMVTHAINWQIGRSGARR